MKRILLPAVFGAVVFFAGATGVASADEPFLCPIVGDGVLNADSHNGDGGVSVITPPAGTSFLPGNNQAGLNANDTAYNGLGGPDNPNNNPGDNPDNTPIWPG